MDPAKTTTSVDMPRPVLEIKKKKLWIPRFRRNLSLKKTLDESLFRLPVTWEEEILPSHPLFNFSSTFFSLSHPHHTRSSWLIGQWITEVSPSLFRSAKKERRSVVSKLSLCLPGESSINGGSTWLVHSLLLVAYIQFHSSFFCPSPTVFVIYL